MADEIRSKEAAANEIIAAAKAESARLLAAARTAGEQAVKEAKQKSHRFFRDETRKAEAAAEEEAVKTVESGNKETELFYGENKSRTAEVAGWLVKEVMSTYGR
jgi:vacuolar-type H+-ATPase subunit H